MPQNFPSTALAVDANGRPALGGYEPGVGPMNISTGTDTADANGVRSAPMQVNVVGTAQPPSIPTTTVTNSTTAAVNTAQTATMAAVAGKTNYIVGFSVTTQGGAGAAAGLVTVTGVLGGTLNFQAGSPATWPVQLWYEFPYPLPASAANTAITINSPTFGANTGAVAVAIWGLVQ